LYHVARGTCHNSGMKLKYETAVATFIQFVTLSFLNMATGLNSVVTTCHKEGQDCISNLIVSIIFWMLVTLWFGFVWLLGYIAQDRRSKRLAQLLIAAEGFIALIAYFNAKHHTDFLSLATSIIDLLLAVWVITLAFRLMRSGGKRITKQRQRHKQ